MGHGGEVWAGVNGPTLERSGRFQFWLQTSNRWCWQWLGNRVSDLRYWIPRPILHAIGFMAGFHGLGGAR